MLHFGITFYNVVEVSLSGDEDSVRSSFLFRFMAFRYLRFLMSHTEYYYKFIVEPDTLWLL